MLHGGTIALGYTYIFPLESRTQNRYVFEHFYELRMWNIMYVVRSISKVHEPTFDYDNYTDEVWQKILWKLRGV